ncbi:MAG: serine/threonine protein phosphatase [Planctomycetaceae bacterium]|nr:serine/threonine protein phosphatase [Planctomycetaceae bacterium]
MTGRVLAFGDIHGCDVALDTMLDYVEPTIDDTVICLGDVIDRGPRSDRVIERLMELRSQSSFVMISGNHEETLEYVLETGNSLEDWMRGFGGKDTVRAYDCSIDELPADHLEFLFSAVDYHETETEIFAHASPHPRVPMSKQRVMNLRWNRYDVALAPHVSGKRIICGHTSQRSARPALSPGWVCIDTWVYGKGSLTCLDVGANQFCQAKQSGELTEWEPLDG